MKICTGCGSTQTIEEIKAEHPSALSCCPERKMVEVEKAKIGNAKLDRIERDLFRITHRHPVDGPTLSRFEYDHSNGIIIDSNGKRDLLFLNTVPLASDAARLLQHCSPVMVEEFVRVYRLAVKAGIV